MFEQIHAAKGNIVKFSTADLKDLPHEDEWFHMVYSVSVLEHTAEYEQILDELYFNSTSTQRETDGIHN